MAQDNGTSMVGVYWDFENIHASLFGGTPVLGAEIERVVRNSPCPVLCVPSARVLTPLGARITVPVPQT